MAKIILLIFLSFALSSCSDNGGDHPISQLEKEVVQQALKDPEGAISIFLQNIESGATIEEQAIYVYGMGVAHEKAGKIEEAIGDYVGAEYLGNESARRALDRLNIDYHHPSEP